MSRVNIQKISYGGWDNCVEISNGIVHLIVTTDVGPRIIRYGFVGKENELCEIKSTLGLIGGDEWRLYGGHRLWHSPESRDRTYEPDNNTVKWEIIDNGIRTIQDVETRTWIGKEMEISLSPEGTEVTILHRLRNHGTWPIEFSVWSITAMATGGIEVIPQTQRDTGLLPNRVMAIWPYTRLDDSRVRWGNQYIIIRHDPDIKDPFKIGLSNEQGWAAYFNHGHLFIKHYTHHVDARYPDFGVSYETYLSDFMLEMETLSPLTTVEPGGAVEHTEHWVLFDNIPFPSISIEEEEIKAILSDLK